MVADFNGDGKNDVAVVGAWTGIVILLGNGNGAFKSPMFAYGSGSWELPSSLLVGDYNLYGKPDLASVSYQGISAAVFSILTNNGDGTFGVGEDLAAGSKTEAVTVASGDFNGDGKLDLAVTTQNKNVTVFLGKGAVHSRPPRNTPPVAICRALWSPILIKMVKTIWR